MRRIRRYVRPGHITAILTAGFAVALLGALIIPLIQTDYPASAAIPAVKTVSDTTSSLRTLQDEKAALMGNADRRMARQERQERLRRLREHRARLAAAAARRARLRAQAPAVTTTSPAVTTYPASTGDYSYSALEALWVASGGSAALEAGAACVAEHESSGNPQAFNGRDEGLWQIDPGNDPGADLFNASVNAAEAVRLQAADGWGPWTTASGCGL